MKRGSREGERLNRGRDGKWRERGKVGARDSERRERGLRDGKRVKGRKEGQRRV